jgi:hypothetical protein
MSHIVHQHGCDANTNSPCTAFTNRLSPSGLTGGSASWFTHSELLKQRHPIKSGVTARWWVVMLRRVNQSACDADQNSPHTAFTNRLSPSGLTRGSAQRTAHDQLLKQRHPIKSGVTARWWVVMLRRVNQSACDADQNSPRTAFTKRLSPSGLTRGSACRIAQDQLLNQKHPIKSGVTGRCQTACPNLSNVCRIRQHAAQ